MQSADALPRQRVGFAGGEAMVSHRGVGDLWIWTRFCMQEGASRDVTRTGPVTMLNQVGCIRVAWEFQHPKFLCLSFL